MIKSEVIRKDTEEKTEFPCLMICNDTIILATGETASGTYAGIILKSSAFNTGYYSEKWYKDSYTKFNGSITLTLTNED